ncbi:hypothetical protein GLOIN_2v637630 [Rhizophagus irregularis DAOM 181602=DAOM 197198]|nr:hypothetical protein GLOIN_2v637630 [Rhizophagus irregularis DAOM 181602=DAOM 197198]
MTLSLLPDECFNNILFFLDYKTLYKCLLVNRYYCKFSIPLIWRDPFIPPIPNKCSLINTLISCLNDEEISSLKSCLIYFEINNNTPPLFEYGRFIRKIDHDYCVNHINSWIKSKSSNKNIKNNNQDYYNNNNKDSKVRKLTKVYFDLVDDDKRYQNTIEFLSNVSKFCNCIINCEFWISNLSNALTKPFLDIIKLQPLERILIDTYTDNYIEKENVEKVIHALEFQYLENLEFVQCRGFVLQSLFYNKKFNFKQLKLWHDEDYYYDLLKDYGKKLSNIMVVMLNSFCSKSLLKLSLNIITPDSINAIHNSLKILGINKFYNRDFDWTNDELEVIGYLKDQGVDIISSDELDINYLS